MRAIKRSFWKPALVVFLVAFTARAAWGVVRWSREGIPPKLEFPDEQQYWGIAASLWRGEGLRDELDFRAGRMPLYPMLLAPLTSLRYGVAGAQLLQWCVGALAAAIVATWARRWGSPVGILAGLMVALDPFTIFTSSLILTESLFIAASLALWWAIWRVTESTNTLRQWSLVGLLAGVCIQLRESSVGLVVAGVVWAVMVQSSRFKSLCGATLSLLIVVAMLTPWAYRNHRVLGEWRWLTTRGGISLYDGVGPQADGGSDLGDVKDSETVRGMNELERDAYFRREVWTAIQTNPARIVQLAGAKLARMWNPIPNVETHRSTLVRLVSAGWTLPIMFFAIVGAAMLGRSVEKADLRLLVFLLLPALYLSMLHSVFVGSVRYRLPAMPFLEILAAMAIHRLIAPRFRRNAEVRSR